MSSAIASSSRQSVQRRAFSSVACVASASSSSPSSSSSARPGRASSVSRHRFSSQDGRSMLPEPRLLHSSSRAVSPSDAEAPPNLSPSSSSSSATSPSGSLPPLARRHPTLYASVRPQQPSALAALAARLHLTSPAHSKAEQERAIQLVAQACTHPSFVHVVRRAKDAQRKLQGARAVSRDPSLLFLEELREETIQDNAQLSALGNSLLGLLGSEALHLKYPHLPTRVLKAALSAYVGPNTTADVGSELGLAGQGILRWDRGETETDAEKEELRFKAKLSPLSTASLSARRRTGAELPSTAVNSRDARSLAVRALLGVIYQEKGLEAVKHILHTRFLSRTVDLASMLKFQDPKRVLSSTCAKYGRERPQSRLIAETGRLSNTPLYVVGVYSGELKLGEGFGSSIKMAEFRSAEDALRRLYLAQAPFDAGNLPSSTLRSSSAAEDGKSSYIAPPLGTSEVVHGSRDQLKA